MKNIKEQFDVKWLVLAAILTVIVIILTHIPQSLMPSDLRSGGLDKVLHAVAYGAITFLLILASKKTFSLQWMLLIIIVLIGIGSLDEITQPLVDRDKSIYDLLADAVGILTVLSFSIVFKNYVQKIKNEPFSRLFFSSAIGFILGILIIPVGYISLNVIKGTNLQKQRKEAGFFFYKTMNDLFEGNYNPDEGIVSEEALRIFDKYGDQLGGKCQLFIYEDWFSVPRQQKGFFSGPAFFPSGDVFNVEIKRTGKTFFLREFIPGEWDSVWTEYMYKIQKAEMESK